MEIYFVRHGQTDGNVGKRHQHPDSPLNELGKLQAAAVAKMLERLRPTHLITSTNKRAAETAKYIGLATDLIPETYPAFEELRRPRFLIGRRFYEWETLRYLWGWFFDLKSATLHDGETYGEFLTRLTIARQHLVQLPPESRVVIVSHGVFITFFLEHMNDQTRMGILRALIAFIRLLFLKNTAVTVVTLTPGTPSRWHIKKRF